jgi:hypothetical protein
MGFSCFSVRGGEVAVQFSCPRRMTITSIANAHNTIQYYLGLFYTILIVADMKSVPTSSSRDVPLIAGRNKGPANSPAWIMSCMGQYPAMLRLGIASRLDLDWTEQHLPCMYGVHTASSTHYLTSSAVFHAGPKVHVQDICIIYERKPSAHDPSSDDLSLAPACPFLGLAGLTPLRLGRS